MMEGAPRGAQVHFRPGRAAQPWTRLEEVDGGRLCRSWNGPIRGLTTPAVRRA
jgi:hypothetical protein